LISAGQRINAVAIGKRPMGYRTGLMAASAGASGRGRLFSNDSGSMEIDEL
jgi:hypothetical protein